jgi:hypothetical protein
MSRDNFQVDLYTPGATRIHPLGMHYVEPSGFWVRGANVTSPGEVGANMGDRDWVYVGTSTDTPVMGKVWRRAAGASTLADCRQVDAGGTMPSCRIPGIGQYTGTAGDYLWLLNKGHGGALADGNSTVDTPFVASNAVAAGDVRDVTAGVNDYAIIGLALDEDGGAIVVVDSWIYCLGG